MAFLWSEPVKYFLEGHFPGACLIRCLIAFSFSPATTKGERSHAAGTYYCRLLCLFWRDWSHWQCFAWVLMLYVCDTADCFNCFASPFGSCFTKKCYFHVLNKHPYGNGIHTSLMCPNRCFLWFNLNMEPTRFIEWTRVPEFYFQKKNIFPLHFFPIIL